MFLGGLDYYHVHVIPAFAGITLNEEQKGLNNKKGQLFSELALVENSLAIKSYFLTAALVSFLTSFSSFKISLVSFLQAETSAVTFTSLPFKLADFPATVG